MHEGGELIGKGMTAGADIAFYFVFDAQSGRKREPASITEFRKLDNGEIKSVRVRAKLLGCCASRCDDA